MHVYARWRLVALGATGIFEEPGDEHRKVNHKTLRASMLVIPLAATPGTPATNRIEGHCYCLHFAGTPRNQ
jgi:hypothetical protein